MTKLPGQSVRGSTSGRPIMVLLDLLGKRWTLRILWELGSGGAASFRELRSRCEEVSPTVLNTRLKDLRRLHLIDLGEAGYELTPYGAELAQMLGPLDAWASRWAEKISE